MSDEILNVNIDKLSIKEVEARLIECYNALHLIKKLGTRYSGFGASCAKIADNVLNGTPLTEQTKKTIQLIDKE